MPRARSFRRSVFAHRVLVFVFLLAAAWGLLLFGFRLAHAQAPAEFSQTTEYYVFARDWWPTTGNPPSEAYAGAQSCQTCHAEKSSTQLTTPMANASYHSAAGAWGAKASAVRVRLGPYVYHVAPHGDDPTLTVGLGNQSMSAGIVWTLGAGVVGQTFVLESKGKLYDSEITSFRGLKGGMDISPAHKPAPAGALEKALGEELTPKLAVRCFACHTTAATRKGQFDPDHATPGVMCEGCHGPGLAHVVAANRNLIEDAQALIFNPRSLNPVEAVDFCGACHTTSADVMESRLFVPSNVRFPPYRLEKSRCWGIRGDRRLACFACHDPHKPLMREASSYDQNCLSCHNSQASQSDRTDSAPQVCPKAAANCTTCHMPKYNVPEMHAEFTDHYIRVVRAGEPYPVQ